MRRQKNMAQMKEQNKTPEKEPDKIETSGVQSTDYKDAQ